MVSWWLVVQACRGACMFQGNPIDAAYLTTAVSCICRLLVPYICDALSCVC